MHFFFFSIFVVILGGFRPSFLVYHHLTTTAYFRNLYMGTFKDLRGSEILLYLQDNMLPWQFHKILTRDVNSWVRDKDFYFSLHSKQHEPHVHGGSSCLLSPIVETRTKVCRYCAHNRFVSQLKNLMQLTDIW